MDSASIAALMVQGIQPATGPEDIALKTGTIMSWDPLTGLNVVKINGQNFSNLSAIAPGIGIAYNTGDTVMIQRKQNKYYIQGRVAAPGSTAGSSIQTGSSGDLQTGLGTTSGVWTSFTGVAPAVPVYISSSRRALVLWAADATVNGSDAEIGWRVDGASNINAGTFAMTSVHTGNTGGTIHQGNVSGSYVITPQFGINQGLNTFTLQYRIGANVPGATAGIGNRVLTVIPL